MLRLFGYHFRAVILAIFVLCVAPRALAKVFVIDGVDQTLSNATFDYVIAGCGIAGLVVANRLSEDANASVMCLEAGPL